MSAAAMDARLREGTLPDKVEPVQEQKHASKWATYESMHNQAGEDENIVRQGKSSREIPTHCQTKARGVWGISGKSRVLCADIHSFLLRDHYPKIFVVAGLAGCCWAGRRLVVRCLFVPFAGFPVNGLQGRDSPSGSQQPVGCSRSYARAAQDKGLNRAGTGSGTMSLDWSRNRSEP